MPASHAAELEAVRLQPSEPGMPADKLIVATDADLKLRSNRACPDPAPEPGTVYVAIGEYNSTGPFQFRSGMGIDGRITARPRNFQANSTTLPDLHAETHQKQQRKKAVDVSGLTPKSYEWAFQENGRILNATVMLSQDATEADLNLAIAVLKSLRIGPPP